MKKTLILSVLGLLIAVSAVSAEVREELAGEEAEKKRFAPGGTPDKTFYCKGTRSLTLSYANCQRFVPEVINGEEVTTEIDCPIPNHTCARESTDEVEFWLPPDECAEAQRRSATFCEAQRNQIVTSIPKTFAELRQEVTDCKDTWEATCRAYALPGQASPAGCVPDTHAQSDQPELIGPGGGIQCFVDCPE